MASLPARSPLEEVSAFLENYWSRNQVLRTLQFASALCAGLLEGRRSNAAAKFSTVSTSIASTRVILRLLDDLPVLVHTLKSWRPNKNSPILLQVSDLAYALTCQLYYPVEHVAWAAECRLLPFPPSPLWTAATFLWALSLLSSLIRSLLLLWRQAREIAYLQSRDQRSTEDHTPSGGGSGKRRVSFQDQLPGNHARRLTALRGQFFANLLRLVQSSSDLMNAVHWMPSGVLWAGKLPPAWVGLFGTISSLIGLYFILPGRTQPPISGR